ncbi:helix-hairpin-helix domain-containing protein [Bacillaceae bacterium IKA-2]|nr:helix-hairpin-helix domain-containing protein [Bacillaceae bacterium IKA-2]
MNKLKRNTVFLIVVGAIVLVFSVNFIKNFNNSGVPEDDFQFFLETEQVPEIEIEEKVVVENVVVDLKGAVNDPGVYVMEQGKRIVDVIERANGFLKEANKDVINLALLLEDEMVIFVPLHGEEAEVTEQFTISSSKDNGKVNINRATAEQLEKIPGIGPAKAAAIIASREEQGTFKSAEEIVRVSGIGQKSLEAMLEFIEVK